MFEWGVVAKLVTGQDPNVVAPVYGCDDYLLPRFGPAGNVWDFQSSQTVVNAVSVSTAVQRFV